MSCYIDGNEIVMNKEKQIKGWLNGSLKEDELIQFKASEEFKKLQKINDAAQLFKAPEFDADASQASIKLTKLNHNKSSNRTIFYKWSAIAAILILGVFIAFHWFSVSNTTITTAANQQEIVSLPDKSKVYLNSNSTLSYSEQDFTDNRTLSLEGEAFFMVESGSTFIVNTPMTSVEVLGTTFNIKSRLNFSEVDCYSGKVKVTDVQKNEAILTSLQRFANYDGKSQTTTFSNKAPNWIGQGKSSFYKTPLYIVLEELATQHQIDLHTESIDTSVIYSGSFEHENLENALQSITLPLQLNYTIQENQVTLQKD